MNPPDFSGDILSAYYTEEINDFAEIKVGKMDTISKLSGLTIANSVLFTENVMHKQSSSAIASTKL